MDTRNMSGAPVSVSSPTHGHEYFYG